MRGDLLAQHQQPLRRRIAGKFARERLQHARRAARPGLDRKQIGRRQPTRQQQPQRRVTRRRCRRNLRQLRAAGRQRHRGHRRGRSRGRGLIRQIRRHICAAAGPPANVTLGRQPLVGQHHRLPRHPEFLRQRPARRQPAAPWQGAAQYAVTKVIEYGALPRLVWSEHGVLAPSIGPIARTLDLLIILQQAYIRQARRRKPWPRVIFGWLGLVRSPRAPAACVPASWRGGLLPPPHERAVLTAFRSAAAASSRGKYPPAASSS